MLQFLLCTGAPLPPATSADVVNATTIELTWTEPFTHQGYGVDHYTVTIENTVTGNITRVDVNETRFMYARVGGIAQECVKFEFTVTASNAVGESSAVAISAGFPTGIYRYFTKLFSLCVCVYLHSLLTPQCIARKFRTYIFRLSQR